MDGRGAIDLAPTASWTATTQTFVTQSLDGSRAWTAVTGPRHDPLLSIPPRDYAPEPLHTAPLTPGGSNTRPGIDAVVGARVEVHETAAITVPVGFYRSSAW
jgi:hypothetical protein